MILSESIFLIILGKCDLSTGGGILPDRVLTLFEDKLIWLFNNLDVNGYKNNNNRQKRRIFTSQSNIMDDALLTASLFILAENGIESSESLQELVKYSKKYFDYDIYKNDTLNCLDGIPPKKLKHLYNLNKIALQDFPNLKFIAINLNTEKIKFGNSINSNKLTRLFLKTVKNYLITSFELCQTTSNFF